MSLILRYPGAVELREHARRTLAALGYDVVNYDHARAEETVMAALCYPDRVSYTVRLRAPEPQPCQTCGRVDRVEQAPVRDPTYNLTPIFDLALTGEPLPNPDVGEAGVVLLGDKTDRPRGLRVLSGKLAGLTIPTLAAALDRLADPSQRSAFEALEPPNRWGTVDDAIKVLRWLLDDAKQFSGYTWDIV